MSRRTLIGSGLAVLGIGLACMTWGLCAGSCNGPAPKAATPASAALAAFDASIYRDAPCFAGAPKATVGVVITILQNTGYDVGYSDERRDPLWAAYTLAADRFGPDLSRPSVQFAEDSRVTSGVTHRDYTNSGFSRGHMAPSEAIGRAFGADAMRGTFIVTNICPQKQALNGGAWEGLEAAEIAIYAPGFHQIWIICGPIFGPNPGTIGTHAVQVPDAFYKIIVEADGTEPTALAVIMNHDVTGSRHALSEFITSVDAIEAKTGLDFLADLPDDLEARIESRPAESARWRTTLVLNGSAIRAGR